MTLAGEIRAEAVPRLRRGLPRRDRSVGLATAHHRARRHRTRPRTGAAVMGSTRRLHAFVAPSTARLGMTPVAGESGRIAELRAALLEADALVAHDADAIATANALRTPTAPTRRSRPRPSRSPPARRCRALRRVRRGDAHRRLPRRPSATGSRSPRSPAPTRSAARSSSPSTAPSGPRTHGASSCAPLLRNRNQGAMAWCALTEHWADVRRVVPSNLLARLLEGISALAEPVLAAEIDAFLEANPVPQGRTVIAQHRERLRVHVAFRRRERAGRLTHRPRRSAGRADAPTRVHANWRRAFPARRAP